MFRGLPRRCRPPRAIVGMIADRRGVSALEYAVIASAMALLLAAMFTALGPAIGSEISQVANRL